MAYSDISIKPKRIRDSRFGTKVTASRDCIYVDRNVKEMTKKIADTMYRLMPHFRKELDLPKGLTIRIGKLKSKTLQGVYYDAKKLVELEPRRDSLQAVLDTAAHELIHAKQYHTGQLARGGRANNYFSKWEGETIKSRGATYKSYRDLPWEKEAFGKSTEVLFKTLVSAYRAGDIHIDVIKSCVGLSYICRNAPDIAKIIKKRWKK